MRTVWEDFETSVKNFNEIAGNLHNVDMNSLMRQAWLVEEEAEEFADAVAEDDTAANILKELADVLVVALGAKQMMEQMGYDVVGACQAVADNNLSKFPLYYEDALASCDVLNKREPSSDVVVACCPEHECFVLIDKNGKIRKPLDYKNVDVSRFVPSN